MDTGSRIAAYDWRGGREAMLRWGPDEAPTVIVALPLFEEANRARATVAAMLEALAARGIGGTLPDLPGTGESMIDTIEARLPDWRTAFAAAAASLAAPVHVVAIRAGALVTVEAEVASTYLLAPQGGRDAVRELRRIQALGRDGSIAGNEVHADLFAALDAADAVTTPPLRVVRLAGDPRPADAMLAFAPPWRAAEPARDDALARALADDIAGWIVTCAG